MPRPFMILPYLGDIEITWGEDEHDTMIALIQKKLDQGMRFFQITVDDSGQGHRQRVKATSDLKGRRIDVGDEDIEALLETGQIAVERNKGRIIDNKPEAITDPHVIAQSQTVGVRPLVGG